MSPILYVVYCGLVLGYDSRPCRVAPKFSGWRPLLTLTNASASQWGLSWRYTLVNLAASGESTMISRSCQGDWARPCGSHSGKSVPLFHREFPGCGPMLKAGINSAPLSARARSTTRFNCKLRSQPALVQAVRHRCFRSPGYLPGRASGVRPAVVHEALPGLLKRLPGAYSPPT